MKKTPIEWVVFWCGEEVGRTMAVSEAQAINNYRFTHRGVLGMWKDDDLECYSAVAAIVLEFRKLTPAPPVKEQYEQMRLPL